MRSFLTIWTLTIGMLTIRKIIYDLVLETLRGKFCAVLCWRLTALMMRELKNFVFWIFVFKKNSIFCFKKWFYHQTTDWIIVRTLDFLKAKVPRSVRGFGVEHFYREIWRLKWQEWSEFIRNPPVMKWGWGRGSIEIGRDSKFKWSIRIGWT